MAGKMRKENIRKEMHLKNVEKITHRNTGLICTKKSGKYVFSRNTDEKCGENIAIFFIFLNIIVSFVLCTNCKVILRATLMVTIL